MNAINEKSTTTFSAALSKYEVLLAVVSCVVILAVLFFSSYASFEIVGEWNQIAHSTHRFRVLRAHAACLAVMGFIFLLVQF